MSDNHLAELAGLSTAVCWAISAVAFEVSGRRLGSLSLNVIRLVIGLGMLAVWGTIQGRGPWPTGLGLDAWGWLSLSALCGIVLGDYCLFRAYIELGPRRSSVVMASVPMWASLIGWALLDEALTRGQVVAIAITSLGIAWAVASKPRGSGARVARRPRRGVLLAGAGAIGQASGLVLSKLGMGDHDPFAATQVRLLAGLGGFALVCTALGWWGRILTAWRDRQAMVPAAIGSFFGPFLGVSLSLLAVQHGATGVAATLMAITPILLIPVSYWRREPVGLGGLAGAALAVLGVAQLMAQQPAS
ncbi:MAG: DMT family transporter [Myxococcales bacterium FL481]|nr:MAG: DMT family transporter [Myxococcales bacterium FL481]